MKSLEHTDHHLCMQTKERLKYATILNFVSHTMLTLEDPKLGGKEKGKAVTWENNRAYGKKCYS